MKRNTCTLKGLRFAKHLKPTKLHRCFTTQDNEETIK